MSGEDVWDPAGGEKGGVEGLGDSGGEGEGLGGVGGRTKSLMGPSPALNSGGFGGPSSAATFTTGGGYGVVGLATSRQNAMMNYLMDRPKPADHTHFVIPQQNREASVTLGRHTDWVYGEHIAKATRNDDGSYAVAGRKLNEYQYNNLVARLTDVREAYDRKLDLWQAAGGRL